MKGDPADPRSWIKLARTHLDRARRELQAGDPSAAAFWLQQAAETGLKGWLIGRGWDLIKTHDLARLLVEVRDRHPAFDPAWFEPAAHRLTQIYFTDRYVDESPDPEPDAAEARDLHDQVERLLGALFPEESG
jgi:HEPN domain-containing protein